MSSSMFRNLGVPFIALSILCTGWGAETHERRVTVNIVCPSTVAVDQEWVVLVAGSGMDSITAAFVDDQPVRAVPLDDSLLDVLLPRLARGTHRLLLVSGQRGVNEINIEAASIGFQEMIHTASCLQDLIDSGFAAGLIFDSVTANALRDEASRIEQAVRDQNVERGLSQTESFNRHLINFESTKVNTVWAEGIISMVNSSLVWVFFDTSHRHDAVERIIRAFVRVVPEKVPSHFELADCEKLRGDLDKVRLAAGGVRHETVDITRDNGKLKTKVSAILGPDGKNGANAVAPGKGGDGGDAPRIRFNMPGLNNSGVVAITGKGGRGGNGFAGSDGGVGGEGGKIDITVGNDDFVGAFSGKGGDGGTGGHGIAGAPNGTFGGAGGAGGDISVTMGTNSILCVIAGDGGGGGRGGLNIMGGNKSGHGGPGAPGGNVTMKIDSLYPNTR